MSTLTIVCTTGFCINLAAFTLAMRLHFRKLRAGLSKDL